MCYLSKSARWCNISVIISVFTIRIIFHFCLLLTHGWWIKLLWLLRLHFWHYCFLYVNVQPHFLAFETLVSAIGYLICHMMSSFTKKKIIFPMLFFRVIEFIFSHLSVALPKPNFRSVLDSSHKFVSCNDFFIILK